MKSNKNIEQKPSQMIFSKYGLNIKNQLDQITKIIANKKKKVQQQDKNDLLTNSSSKKSSFQTDRPPSKSNYKLSSSKTIKNREQPQKNVDVKRNLVYNNQLSYQSQSYHSSLQTNKDNQKSINQTLISISPSQHPLQNIQQACIEDFTLMKKLGQGKFGEVYLAKHNQTNLICAIKKIDKNKMTPKLIVQITRQIKIQFNLNHPNIVKLYTFFSDKQCLYLVQQLCYSGQLYTFLKKKKRLQEITAKNIIQQICKALDYMHECQIIHRDIKPQNIIFQNGLIKICDFGWSISTKTMRETFCGTPLYVSPELLKKKNYNNKIDVWSIGILTYELLFGRVPFQITTEQDFIKIVQDEISFLKNIQISKQAKDFIGICLKKDPRDRYTIPQLLQHPFIAFIQNPLLSQLY